MSEIENGRLGLYGTTHSKCNHMMTLGFKGLAEVAYLCIQLQKHTYIMRFTHTERWITSNTAICSC